ncbi:stage II sporulation protein M [Propionicicella superfundia]|uniref:stage II sporulation protein M n=1 Tax=Propionicicella superfundia TaxID=348582 RepID=UPI000409FFB9|nr:stage II sporulation protein M [Propionicicella superfundia]
MDVDAYVLEHRDTWNRLDRLVKRQRPTGAEADEIVDLYQRTATHLAVIRGSTYDPTLEARLSTLVTNARAVVTGTSVPLMAAVAYFFTATFPAAVYRLRWAWIAIAAVSVLTAFGIGYRVVTVPGLEQTLISPEALQSLLDHDFAAYYSENPAGDFAAQVWLNNSVVAATFMITGIAVYPLALAWWSNMQNLGIVGGLMVGNGRADVFYGLILPHGLLELTCLFIAAAAGLSLAWAVVSPGPRTRARALAEQGRRVGAIAVGLACALAVSGVLEAFLTPSRLPAAARLAIGAAVWLAFLAYVLILGRLATRGGETGDVDAGSAGFDAPTEAA